MMNNLRYDYAGDDRLLEGADWIGRRSAGLRLHFHDEVQVSLIWSGQRDYRIGMRHVRLQPGQILVIPRHRPHHALPSLDPNIRSAEFYFAENTLSAPVRSSLQAFDYLIADEPWLNDLAPSNVTEFIAAKMTETTLASVWKGPVARPNGDNRLLEAIRGYDSIADAAFACRISREGFIRAFSRSFGMTPHCYRINDQLNRGRRLLRDGEGISRIAYASGFSDQSHFGRMFLQFFGATPGQFRAAHLVS